MPPSLRNTMTASTLLCTLTCCILITFIVTETHAVSLTNGTVVTTPSGTNLTLKLSEDDLNALKAQYNLATGQGSTFLNIEPGAIRDLSGNPESVGVQGLQPLAFRQDVTAPQLRRFDLNMSTQHIVLALSFSEPIHAARLNPEHLALVAGIQAQPQQAVPLRGAFPADTNANSTTHTLVLDERNVRELQLARNVCNTAADCFLVATASAAKDMAGNDLQAIPPNATLAVSTFTPDATPPVCTAFLLDMDAARIVLNFTEVIDTATVNLTRAAFVSTATAATEHTLAGQVTFPSTSSLSVAMPEQLMNELKVDLGVGHLATESQLRLLPAFVKDTQAIDNPSQLLLPQPFIADTTAPVLRSFIFNTSNSHLLLSFDEPVVPETLDPTKITMHNNASTALTLTSGRVVRYNDVQTEITWALASSDAVHVAQLETLAVSPETTFITAAPGLVNDTQNNPFSQAQTLAASQYIQDTVPPRLVAFNLSMTTLQLDLQFSEVVDHASFNVTGITFVNGGQSYTLTGQAAQSNLDKTSLTVTLTTRDANEIKARTSICTSQTTTKITAVSGFVADQAGNPSVAAQQLRAQAFTADATSPEVVAFTLDMETEALTLTFSETVDVASIQPGLIAIQALADLSASNASVAATAFPGDIALAASDVAVVLDPGSAVHPTGTLTTARITLTVADVNRIKARHLLATDAATTFLAASPHAAQDMAGNDVVGLPHTSALGLAATAADGSVYTADASAPLLVAFDLDMDSGELVLSFDEPVRGALVNASSAVVQSNVTRESDAAGPLYHRIVDGRVVAASNATTVRVQLSVGDVNAIRTVRALASSAATTYLSWDSALAEDMVGLGVVGAGASAGVRVQQYGGDVSQPLVVSAVLNMTSETLALGFDEPVDASTLQISGKITFESRRVWAAGDSSGIYSPAAYTLQGGAVVGGAGNGERGSMGIVVRLAADDVLALKANRALLGVGPVSSIGASEDVVGVRLGTNAVLDMASNGLGTTVRNLTLGDGNGNTGVSMGGIMAAAAGTYAFYADTAAPQLTAAVIDVNASRVVLNFDEPVHASALDATLLSAVSGSGQYGVSGQWHALGGGSTTSMDGTQVEVVIERADLRAIQLLVGVWTNASTAWVHALGGLVSDMSGNALETSELAAADFVADEIRPRIVGVELDMDQGRVVVNMSEPVAVASVNVSAVTLQRGALVVLDAAGANASAEWGNPYLQRLSSNTTVLTQTNGLGFVLELVRGDMDALKVKGIGSSVATTWLTATSDLVVDMAGRRVRAAVNGQSAVQAGRVVADATAPVLERFSLDMDAARLVLWFSETVESSSLSTGEVVLQGRAGALGGLGLHEVYQLGTSSAGRAGWAETEVVSGDGPVQVVSLGRADMEALKLRYGVATARSTTLLSFGSALVADHAGNAVVGVAGASAVEASVFGGDVTPPRGVAVRVDLAGAVDSDGVAGRTMTLNVTFDEPVVGGVLNVSSIVLYGSNNSSSSSSNSSSAVMYRLQDGVSGVATGTENGTEVVVVVGRADANAIRALPGLCADASTCLVGYESTLVRDMAGNAVVARGAAAGTLLAPAQFVADDVAPVLEGVGLDMDAGVLELSFSETLDVTRVVASRVMLYSAECGGGGGGGGGDVRYNVSGGVVYGVSGLAGGSAVAWARVSAVVRVNLTEGDLNELRALSGLVRGVGSTYVGLRGGAVIDMSGNAVEGTVPCGGGLVQATAYVPDATRPRLQAFVLDMDNHLLHLTFSETINASSFDMRGLSFVGYPSVDLSTSAIGSTSLLEARVNLSVTAVRALEVLYNLCSAPTPTSGSPCDLSVQANFAEDGFGNAIVPDVLTATTVVLDARAPRVLSFDLDMTQHRMLLTFSEVVMLPSVNTSAAVLVNGAGVAVRLSAETIVSSLTNATTIELSIGGRDLEQLELEALLAVSAATTQVVLEAGFVTDMAGNALAARPAVGVGAFVPDRVRPRLSSWRLNMNIGILTLVFSEIVNASSLNVHGIGLQDNPLAYRENGVALAAMTLSGGSVLSSNNHTIHVLLNAADLNLLKRLDGVATQVVNSYITLTSSTVRDMAGNSVVAIVDGAAERAAAFVEDTTSPVLTGFDLEQDVVGYPLRLLLRFSETVDVTTFDLTKVVLHETAAGGGAGLEEKRLTGGKAEPIA